MAAKSVTKQKRKPRRPNPVEKGRARPAAGTGRHRFDDVLADSHRMLSTLIENLPGMVYRCRNDRDWTMEFMSEGCLALTGYSADDFVVRRKISYGQLMHPADQEPVWVEVQAALKEKRPFQLVYRITNAGGGLKWVWEQGRGVFAPDGKLLALEGFVTDITERKRSDEAMLKSESRLRSIVKTALNVIIVLSPDRRILEFNPEAERVYGRRREEVLGKDYFELFLPRELWEPVERDLRQVMSGQETRGFENAIHMADGGKRFMTWNVCRMDDGLGQGFNIVAIGHDVTQMLRFQKELKNNEEFLDRSQRIASVGSWELDVATNRVKWSDELYRLYGVDRKKFDSSLDSILSCTHPDDMDRVQRTVERLLHQVAPMMIEFRIRRPDGSVRWMQALSESVADAGGKIIRLIGTVRDITETKISEDALWESEAKYRTLFELAKDAIFLVRDGVFVDCNQRTLEMFGCQRHDIIGLSPIDFSPPDQPDGRPSKEKALEKIAAASGGEPQFFEWEHTRHDGTTFRAEVSLNAIELKGERYLHAIVRDVTERMQAQERLQHLAHHDALTNLPNRAMFLERLEHALTRARWTKRPLAVLFLDLDRFKNINDTLGHDIGDNALRVAAERLTACVREGDTVARLGGDEFTVLLEDLANSDDVPNVAQKILDALSRPFAIEGREFVMTTSIGISLYPSDGDDSLKLLRNADTAMYRAKEQGRNKHQFYSSEMSAKALEKFMLESGLRRALERKEFLLYYQPQVDLTTGRITGVEALLRWKHPELGLVSPVQFIPVAEETGLMKSIDEWVLLTACLQAQAWRSAGLPPVTMSVNLSGSVFGEQKLAETISRIMGKSCLVPELLELEITESAIMHNAEPTLRMLGNLKRMGIRLALDDFGTGYSSLSYLKRFPIDTLKIDQSFVQDVTRDGDDASLVEAIIVMGHALKLKVIAEGVETSGQLAFLRQHGCDGMQGFFFSRPLPAEEITRLLQSGKKL